MKTDEQNRLTQWQKVLIRLSQGWLFLKIFARVNFILCFLSLLHQWFICILDRVDEDARGLNFALNFYIITFSTFLLLSFPRRFANFVLFVAVKTNTGKMKGFLLIFHAFIPLGKMQLACIASLPAESSRSSGFACLSYSILCRFLECLLNKLFPCGRESRNKSRIIELFISYEKRSSRCAKACTGEARRMELFKEVWKGGKTSCIAFICCDVVNQTKTTPDTTIIITTVITLNFSFSGASYSRFNHNAAISVIIYELFHCVLEQCWFIRRAFFILSHGVPHNTSMLRMPEWKCYILHIFQWIFLVENFHFPNILMSLEKSMAKITICQ